MHGCCNQVTITQYVEIIKLDNHKFCVTINYCRNCGQLKATTNIRELLNDN